jgi:hypothetical protein
MSSTSVSKSLFSTPAVMWGLRVGLATVVAAVLVGVGGFPQPAFAVTDWSQVGDDIDGEAALDKSGDSVSFSGDGTTVAIGAPDNDGTGKNSGHVRVYTITPLGEWAQVGADIDGEAAGDRSGQSVSLSDDGTMVAIGAPLNDGSGKNAGHVRVYSFDGTAWVKVGDDIDGEANADNSGWSVSLSGDSTTVAIGAYKNDGNGSNSGHVRVYSFDGAVWAQVGADIDGEAANNFSGHSVSLSSDGTTVATGAYFNDESGENAGHVRVYSFDGAVWAQVGADIDGEAAGDRSGHSVSLSDDGATVAIGAHFNDESGKRAGHVRVYELSSGSWAKVGGDIDGEKRQDRSGYSVSLNGDGTMVAIGAPDNDGTGKNSGHVRVYSFVGTEWVQVGQDIDGEAKKDDSGRSVSLSNDGAKVAIGAPLNDAAGDRAGHVRVYRTLEPVYDSTLDLGVADGFSLLAGAGITTGASNVFPSNIGAGAAVTTGAGNVIPGSLLAGAAITTGAGNVIEGSLDAGAALTLGAANTISGPQAFGVATPIAGYSAAMAAVNVAMADALSRPAVLMDTELGGTTLEPGVYAPATYFTLTGVLTLDAKDNPDAVFIVRSPGYISTAAGSSVVLLNGAKASNVFWVTGSYFSAGADAVLAGTVMANGYVTMGAGAELEGRVFSQSGYITLGSDVTLKN